MVQDQRLKQYITLLKNEILRIPLKWDRSVQDFTQFIEDHLRKYIDYLHSLIVKEEIIAFIEDITPPLIEIIRLVYMGHMGDEQGKSYGLFSKYQKILMKLCPQENPSSDETILYRGRSSDDSFNEIKTKENMYHPPFENRYQIKTERYSIAGFPCLYLGQSAYICWVELGRPELSRLNISRYQFDENALSFIDLSWRPIEIVHFYENTVIPLVRGVHQSDIDLLENYIRAWPLIMSCSITPRESNKNDVFKPEYIIPQFLLQYIIEKKPGFDGVKYFSTKVDYAENPLYDQMEDNTTKFEKNYAIPVKCSHEKDFCRELMNKFQVSLPISPQKLEIAFPNGMKEKLPFKDNGPVNLDGIKKSSYYNTLFGQLETFLELIRG